MTGRIFGDPWAPSNIMLVYSKSALRRTSHKTDTSLRRTFSHVPAERRCVSHRKTSIRRTIVRRTPLQDGHFSMSQQKIFIEKTDTSKIRKEFYSKWLDIVWHRVWIILTGKKMMISYHTTDCKIFTLLYSKALLVCSIIPFLCLLESARPQ